MDKSFTPVTLSNFPIYLLTLVEIQANRKGMRKQTVLEEGLDYGLELFKEKRKGQIEKLRRAKTSLFEETISPHKVHKIFSNNNLSLSDGPDLAPTAKMGFLRRRSVRISSSLDEEIGNLSEGLGISKTFLVAAFLMLFFMDNESIGKEWKAPMIDDLRKFLAKLDEIEEEIKDLLGILNRRKGVWEDYSSKDIF